MSFPYAPQDNELLYHYCGPEAFLAICTGRTLRFGDLAHMNDSSEGTWGYSVWIEAANRLLPELGESFVDVIDQIVHERGYSVLPLGACLSQDGDVLSQWRAYADDGAGYAVGFAADDLERMPARMLQVIYDHERQVDEVVRFVRAIHEVEQGEEIQFGDDFVTACRTLAVDLFRYKNPAFVEEREVRLIRVLVATLSGTYFRVEDVGGHNGEEDRPALDVRFRITRGAPTPYLDVDVSDGERLQPIRRVVIGPRNLAPAASVAVFLETIGLSGVEVVRSTASYR